MVQEKRGLFPYEYERYMLAELPDGRPNLITHAYGHRDLKSESTGWPTSQSLARSLSFGTPLERFAQKHVRFTRRLEIAGAMEMEK